VRVLLPNLRTAMLSATVLTVALVLGEFTMASLDLYQTFPVWIVAFDQTSGPISIAASLLALFVTWIFLLAITLIGGRGSRRRGGAEVSLFSLAARTQTRGDPDDDERGPGHRQPDGRDPAHHLRSYRRPAEPVADVRHDARPGRADPAARSRGTGGPGPSGCGKTTALRIMAGFETTDSGTVEVDGRDVSGVPAAKRGMGMVFQSYSLFPNMSALDNVSFGLRMRRAGAEHDQVGAVPDAGLVPHRVRGQFDRRRIKQFVVAQARVGPGRGLLEQP
jgi:ABC transporter